MPLHLASDGEDSFLAPPVLDDIESLAYLYIYIILQYHVLIMSGFFRGFHLSVSNHLVA
jgi:hypothetical protein